MRMVLNEPIPVEVTDLLARRRALGQDTHDEVWNGEYHMNPAPHPDHSYIESGLHAVLRRLALAVDLVPMGQVNIGASDNYRIPDLAVFRQRPRDVFIAGAAIVVEVLSPDDESWAKFGHYFDVGVEEILIVDSATRSCVWYERGEAAFSIAAASVLLGVTGLALADELDW